LSKGKVKDVQLGSTGTIPEPPKTYCQGKDRIAIPVIQRLKPLQEAVDETNRRVFTWRQRVYTPMQHKGDKHYQTESVIDHVAALLNGTLTTHIGSYQYKCVCNDLERREELEPRWPERPKEYIIKYTFTGTMMKATAEYHWRHEYR
jgi:hypothetical protein